MVPDWIDGGVILVAVVVAVPLLWPLLLAIGWAEGALAGRVLAGASARRSAARILLVQACALVLLGAMTAVVVVVERPGG